ncbi:MAG: PP2C family protein-serine/threonine phosphatase [Lentisphaeria bacterium]
MKDTTAIRISPSHTGPEKPRNNRRMFDVATRSNRGRVRETNEDSFLVVQIPGGNDLLMAVADGVSGGQAGDIASKYALQAMLKAYMEQRESELGIPDIDTAEEVLSNGIEAANKRLDHLNSNLDGKHFMIGTTITALILLPQYGVVANAGDSRGYQWHNQKLEQLTKDHTWAQNLVDIGELLPEEVAGHPWEHTLSNCLGSLPEIVHSVRKFERSPGDKYLLCTDGVTQMMDNSELRDIIAQNKSATEIAEEIVVLCLHRGGFDNLTLTLSC